MMCKNKLSLVVLFAVFGGPTLYAAETELPAVKVEGVTGSAAVREDLNPTSTHNPYRVSRSSQLASQVITRESIEELKPRDVFDLIDKATGTQVSFQGRKYPYQVKIRGDSNFAFIIDGAYVPPVTGGRILQNLPLSAIEEIQVVRDASALVLGPMTDIGASTTGSLNNGFIVIRTHRPGKTELTAHALIEQNDTYGLSSSYGEVFGDEAKPQAYASLLGARYQTQGKDDWYNARNSSSLFGNAGYAGKAFRVDTTVYHDRGQYQFQRGAAGEATVGTNASPGVAYAKWSYSPLDTTFATTNASVDWNTANRTLLSLSYTRVTDTDRMDYYAVPPAKVAKAGSEVSNEDTMTYAALRHSVDLATGTLLQFGGNYLHWNTPTGETNFEGYPREETVVSGFAVTEQSLWEKQVLLDASVRVDHKHIDTGWENIANSQGKAVSLTFHDRDLPSAYFYALGASWQANANWLVNARYMHGSQGTVSGVRSLNNAPLQGANQDKFELGTEAALSSAFTPSATWFFASIRHDKYVAQTDTKVSPYVSYYAETDTRRQGFELIARGALSTGTSYRMGWTHFVKQYASTNTLLSATSPKNLFDITLSQTIGAYKANLSAKRVGGYFSNNFANDGLYHEVGKYTRVDMNVSRDFHFGPTRLNVSVYGRNLSDSHYESIYSFPDIGRVFGIEFGVEY